MSTRGPRDISRLRTILEIEQELFKQPLASLVVRLSCDGRLERAWRRIERDYGDCDLSLSQVAASSGASRNHLNVLFRQAINLTVHQLLVRYRLAKALEMMNAKNHTILHIALESGFGSINTFERNCRVVLGATPREIRARQETWRANQDF